MATVPVFGRLLCFLGTLLLLSLPFLRFFLLPAMHLPVAISVYFLPDVSAHCGWEEIATSMAKSATAGPGLHSHSTASEVTQGVHGVRSRSKKTSHGSSGGGLEKAGMQASCLLQDTALSRSSLKPPGAVSRAEKPAQHSLPVVLQWRNI